MNLWYFHLSSNSPSALEEFKTRHEVEGRGGLTTYHYPVPEQLDEMARVSHNGSKTEKMVPM